MVKLKIEQAIKWLKKQRKSARYSWSNNPHCLLTRVVRGLYPKLRSRYIIVCSGGDIVRFSEYVNGCHDGDETKLGEVPFHDEFWDRATDLGAVIAISRDQAIEILEKIQAEAKIAG